MFYFPPQIFSGRVGELFLFYAARPLALYDYNDYLCTIFTAKEVLRAGKMIPVLHKPG